jgi:hypothetical protein
LEKSRVGREAENSVDQLPTTGTLALAGKTATVTCTGATKVAISFVDIRADSVPVHSDEATGTTTPKEATVFTFDLKATPALSSALGGITETANLDGNATINFEYL